MAIRRVEVGQAEDGRTVLGDQDLPPIAVSLFPGAEFIRVWGSDSTPQVPGAMDATQPKDWFPPPGVSGSSW